MLQEFKTFNKERLDMTELVALASYGRGLQAEFDTQQVGVPEFVKDQNASLSREIQSRVADAKAARVKAIKSSLEALKTASERKETLLAELASLEPAVTA